MGLMIRTKRTAQIFAKMWRYLQLSDFEGANYQQLKQRFVRELIRHFNFEIHESGSRPQIPGAVIYVCNHISYMDIPLVMLQLPLTSFVSKAEVGSWPLIGQAARRVETIFVKRESKSSRENTRKAVLQALTQEHKKVVVFPSSTTSIFKTDKWRKGIFEIAQASGTPVVPVRFSYSPLREVAYIDDDNFVKHMLHLVSLPQVHVQFEYGEPFQVTNPIEDCARVQAWCEERMAVAPGAEMADAVDLPGSLVGEASSVH